MKPMSSSKLVVYAALIGNILVALTKFVAAAMTGSSAMLSEGVHSLVDTINEFLLLYGLKRADKRPDATHPFGYGRELYFWSFIVALLVLALGAGVSFYEGITHIQHPEPIAYPNINYFVLAVSFVFEIASWWISLKTFRTTKGTLSYFQAFRQSKDPSVFVVLFEDTAALLGLLIAMSGVVAVQIFNMPKLDGVASIAISMVLIICSILLVRETKELLIGETAKPHVRESILRIAKNDPGISNVNGILTVQMGPRQVIAALSAEFHDDLTTTQIEQCVSRIEAGVKLADLNVVTLFVKPQSAEAWQHRISPLAAQQDDAPI